MVTRYAAHHRLALALSAALIAMSVMPVGATDGLEIAASGPEAFVRGDGSKPARFDDIGGDDVFISENFQAQDEVMAIASNGDIFVAVEFHNDASVPRIQVYRSRDGGDTWQEWGYFGADDEQHSDPCLLVAEGAADRCFLAYTRYTVERHFSVEVAYIDLDAPTADWTRVAAVDYADMYHYAPSLACDDVNYTDYNLYLVCAGRSSPPTPDPADIWFTRSTDQGATFETPYKIANLNTTDTDYGDPAVAYGFGDYVHVAWTWRHHDQAFDEAIRYRRAGNRAAGGSSSAWDNLQSITSTSDGMWDFRSRLVASPVSSDVILVCNRRIWLGGVSWDIADPMVLASSDQGATFADPVVLVDGLELVYGAVFQPTTASWIIGGNRDQGAAIQRAGIAAPAEWSDVQVFSDGDIGRTIWKGRVALDPSRDHRVGISWMLFGGGSQPHTMFDAEWRTDPGYPNLEPGSPFDIDHLPISPPALVDLDGDGDLEIVYSSHDQRIQVYHHDGYPMDGWPVDTNKDLTDGPVAVGALTADGTLYVVAGTTDGMAVAYLANGDPAPGWPFDSGTGEPAYVSIGALGGDDPRSVVVASGERLTFANWQGELPDGALVRNHYFRTHSAPCAIGDIDGDEIAEVVCGPGDQVLAFEMRSTGGALGRYLPSDISDAITLADLDLDGDVEIVAPTADGTLYAMYGNGLDYAGAWPFASASGTPLTSAAIAERSGGSAPELAVGARAGSVHRLGNGGGQQPGYPVVTGSSGDLFAAPILGLVAGGASDIVIGDGTELIWSWNEDGAVNPGFPRGLWGGVIDSPALGDVDQDGSVELVVVTSVSVLVYDLNRPVAAPEEVWPMYGHDPQRTGCADCPEDVTTPVPDDESAVTRASFAPPSPNPIAGQGTFRFALPVRAAVSLEILDLRGRRVATVLKEERESGVHFIAWNGRDQRGRAVAAGQYLARLQVRGSGIDEVMTRKVTILH